MTMPLFDTAPLQPLAALSPCGTYRYTLPRGPWDASLPVLGWHLLNPSRATTEIDDATSIRIVNFSKDLGFGAALITNPFAYRATDPNDLAAAAAAGVDVIGPDNDHQIREATSCAVTVLGWGSHGARYPGRISQVVQLLVQGCRQQGTALAVLGWTNSGHPRHPLYMPKNSTLSIYRPGGRSVPDALWQNLIGDHV
ncbi:DUF1643 domain-containing protein [Mycobacteroides abscessus subsp. abscessus]|uniref:DUF1643 domain-containing protein n=1 Tax=Mycobacteroides abscessus TaxID=36809 RepID=UPI00092C9015|nr:DUF1643 domain-containing protein [Mycobacteroides abscessus]MDO2987030.1 DUF1643 domain-containing protein [Mycobacteroides abscessus subsp. abscessus]SID29638.1 Uncharacterized protein conserved in bacteria [Mycobacteroides abscessus subsp. abscessus]SIJ90567.1 Uncharacterized protein conserved in bacteria [Mycobacteroides abscessus subsp. abscessus]